jgi:hypothetical protein
MRHLSHIHCYLYILCFIYSVAKLEPTEAASFNESRVRFGLGQVGVRLGSELGVLVCTS